MSGRRLDALGVSAPVPSGWEGGVRRTPLAALGPTPSTTSTPSTSASGEAAAAAIPVGDLVVLHLANVPLAPERGDFGGTVVASLGPGGAFVALVEFEPASAATALFTSAARPTAFTPADLAPEFVRNGTPDQSGAQRFFVDAGRPFCLYVVVGSHRLRRLLLPEVNGVLAGLSIAPRPS